MRKDIKILLTFLMFTFCFGIIYSQEVDRKYLLSIIYLQSSNEVNNKVRDVFKIKSKKLPIGYILSEEINFINLEEFEDDLKSSELHLPFDINLLGKKGKFKEVYEFKPEKRNFKNILSYDKGILFVNFSKPIGNILALEISRHSLSPDRIKFGRSIKILFYFNKLNRIERVYTVSRLYN